MSQPKKLVLLAVVGATALLLALECVRCHLRSLPVILPSAALDGPSVALVNEMGPPTRVVAMTEKEISQLGVLGLSVPTEALESLTGESGRVLIWERTCFLSSRRFYFAIVDPESDRIVHSDGVLMAWR